MLVHPCVKSLACILVGLACHANLAVESTSGASGQSLHSKPGRGRRVLIVGLNQATAKHLPSALRECGFEPILVLDSNKRFEAESKESVATCETYVADLSSDEGMAALFVQHPELRTRAHAITTFVDPYFPAIRTLAERYSMQSPDPAIPRLSSKAELYRLLPEFAPQGRVFTLATLSREDFSSLPKGKDFILKASLSAGASGSSTLRGRSHLKQRVRRAILRSGLSNAGGQEWILQERIPGRLISLEGFVQNGNLKFLGFSRRARIGLTEVLNEFPGDATIPGPAKECCRRALMALVERSNYRNGYFHCEFIIDGDSARIIDGNIGRVAGAGVAEQIALSYGLAPKEVIRHAVLLPLFPDLAPSPYRVDPAEAIPTWFVAYGLRDPVVLNGIDVPTASLCRHTQFAATGSKVVPMGKSNLAAIGGLSGFKEDVIKTLDALVIQTSKGPMKPVFVTEDE